MSNSKRNIVITGLVVLLIIILFFFLGKANNNSYIPEQKYVDENCNFNLQSKIAYATQQNIINSFPYEEYLTPSNIQNITCIKSSLIILDSITKDPTISQQILFATLTDSLAQKNYLIYNTYKPDSLIRLMQWVEKFQYYAEIDEKNKLLFRAIYDYWLTFISDKLTNYVKENPAIKFEFKFKFLVAKCSERRYNIGVKVTSTEKVIDNIIRSKWGHLFDASWNQASILQKTLFALLLIIFLYGIYCIILKHFFK